jgi:hypothetical protein
VNTQLSHAHHYVAQWYQRRFLRAGLSKYYYLDLHPEVIVSGKTAYRRRALLHWGPAKCFFKDDLYTLNVGNWTTETANRTFS